MAHLLSASYTVKGAILIWILELVFSFIPPRNDRLLFLSIQVNSNS